MKQVNIGILGATFSGNKGAEAMITSLIQQFAPTTVTDSKVVVLSYFPGEDQSFELPSNVSLVSATPAAIITTWLIATILPKSIGCRLSKNISKILSVDILLDVSGVSFNDGRFKYLPYQTLSLLPFLAKKIPVVKCSQAMGSFKNPLNRISAKWFLNRSSLVVCRGKATRKFVDQLKLRSKVIDASDLAFLLEYPKREEDRSQVIGIAPSSLLMTKSSDYVSNMAQLCSNLIEDGYEIELLCHSWRKNTTEPRNNDVICANAILKEIHAPENVKVIGPNMDSTDLKRHISGYRVLVTSRFHGMIAALGTCTPPYVIGWSHKYEEVLEDFELTHLAIKEEDFDPDQARSLVGQLFNDAGKVSAQISKFLPAVKSKSETQIRWIADCLSYE